MIEAMIKETGLRKSDLNIETIYFGGGTPSLLNAGEISSLLDAVSKNFRVSENAEITLEANPDDINDTILREWKDIGINRLSLGVQSFFSPDLAWMNRIHNAQQAIDSIKLIKSSGYNNFSADLIYGTPTLSDEELIKNIEILINEDVPHIATYALTVEPSTALEKMIRTKKVADVDSEVQSRQYRIVMDLLRKAGYEHYEISNFAKPGFRSRHNSSYWKGVPYTGIGPSAHSFADNKRSWNISNNPAYIKALEKNTLPYEEEDLSKTQQLNEFIMISLRTLEGLDTQIITEKFGKEKTLKILEDVKKYGNDKIIIEDGVIKLTDEGKLFADGIAADLFFN